MNSPVSTIWRESQTQQWKDPFKLQLMSSIKKLIIQLQQLPAGLLSQSALIAHARIDDSTLLGFWIAISTLTKKLVDYELLNRICEKWTDGQEAREEHPNKYQEWYNCHKANCKVIIWDRGWSQLYNQRLRSWCGVNLSRKEISSILPS